MLYRKSITRITAVVIAFLSLTSFYSGDCDSSPPLAFELVSITPQNSGAALIKHVISGLRYPADVDRKISIFYAIHAFKNNNGVEKLDANLGWQVDVVSHAFPSPISADGRLQFQSEIMVNPSGRLAAIKKAKAKGKVDKVTLTVIFYQQNWPCALDKYTDIDVTAYF